MKRIQHWQDLVSIVVGLWLVASPWILEFTDIPAAKENAIACGALLGVLALWVLGTDRAFGGWFQRGAR